MAIAADGWYIELVSSIINYTKKSLKPHGLSDFSFRGVFLQPRLSVPVTYPKILKNPINENAFSLILNFTVFVPP